MQLPFVKMHGLGNDFAVFDHRDGRPFDAAWSAAIADRRRGVGCDQVIVLSPSERADVFMRIYNPDGSEAQACGNATRCVVDLLSAGQVSELAVETVAGILPAHLTAGLVEVDMGEVRTRWDQIPLARAMDTTRLDFGVGPLHGPVAVNVGNPHVVFFVLDTQAVDLAALGPQVEHHPLFPERTNVGVLTVDAPDRLRLRVWERGAGITEACGSAACAAVVAAHRRGFGDRHATVQLDGGELAIAWREADNHILMRGPTARVFDGIWTAPLTGTVSARSAAA